MRSRQTSPSITPIIVGLLAALTLSSVAAAADVPAGFTSKPGLAAKAATIAGKSVTVLCASDAASWQAEEATFGRTGGDYLGHVDAAGGTTIYLSPTICAPLLWAKPKKARDLLMLQGAALELLAHEAEHLAGHLDEGETECAALAVVRRFARVQFGVRDARALSIIVQGAWSRHRAAVKFSPAYAGSCG